MLNINLPEETISKKDLKNKIKKIKKEVKKLELDNNAYGISEYAFKYNTLNIDNLNREINYLESKLKTLKWFENSSSQSEKIKLKMIKELKNDSTIINSSFFVLGGAAVGSVFGPIGCAAANIGSNIAADIMQDRPAQFSRERVNDMDTQPSTSSGYTSPAITTRM